MVQQKIQAFRQFASQLAQQVTEQLCAEFEREVGQVFEEAVQYRDELARVLVLLEQELDRQKKLHSVIEGMNGHASQLHEHAKNLASKNPGQGDELMHWFDKFTGMHLNLLNDTANGVAQGHGQIQNLAGQAGQLKNESITTEHEFTRIATLLHQPLIPTAPGVGMAPGVRPVGAPAVTPGALRAPAVGAPGRTPTPPRSPAATSPLAASPLKMNGLSPRAAGFAAVPGRPM